MTARAAILLCFSLAIIPFASGQSNTLNVGVILPTDTPITDVSARRVLKMTESDINSDPSFATSGVTFNLVFASSNSSKSESVERAIDFASNQQVVGVVGEYTSDNTQPIALALNSFKVYQCGVASNPDFSDKSVYKYFFRTVPSDQYQGYAMADLVTRFGWAKVGVITVNSPYGLGLSTAFLQRASDNNITVLRNEAYTSGENSYRLQVQSLKEADARIIILIAFDSDVIEILREARKQGMLDSGHVWIGSDGVQTIYSLLYENDGLTKYTDEDRANIEGMILTTPNEYSGGKQKENLDSRYKSQYGADILTYSYFFRDCLLTMALGIKRQLASGVSIDRIRSRSTGANVVDFVSQVSFNGSSGPVSYDKNGDRVIGFQVWNVVNKKLVPAMVTSSDGSFTTLAQTVFYGGSSVIPADGVILTRDSIDMLSGLGITFIGLAVIGFLITLVSVFILIIKRSTAPVRAMSLPFLIIAGVGIMIEFLSVFGWVGSLESMNGIGCVIQQWGGWIGFSLLMQSILPKCWRIYCIFENTRMYSASHLKDKYLLLLSLPILAVNVLILMAFQAMDPLKPVRVDTVSTGKFHFECKAKSEGTQLAFNIVLMSYNGLLLLIAIALAYATRNAASAYRETAYILYAVQNVLLSGVVVVAVVFSGGAGFLASVALRVAVTLSATFFVLAVIISRIALAALWNNQTGDGLRQDRHGRAVKLKGGMMDEGSQSGVMSGTVTGSSTGSDTFINTSTGVTEFMIPVKDGGKTFALWERRKILFSSGTRLLAIVNMHTKTGESVILDNSVSIIASKLPDCLEIRYGRAFKILQFGNSRSMETFLELTVPALKASTVVIDTNARNNVSNHRSQFSNDPSHPRNFEGIPMSPMGSSFQIGSVVAPAQSTTNDSPFSNLQHPSSSISVAPRVSNYPKY
ncbi:hypothetical protein HDU97_009458 [Phlyctochytrium planicorne]|nr:hypothetical protein HDU97_009458 [Phlyctochytrium planicorne]